MPKEAAGVEEKPDVAQVYLLFCSNVLSLFEEVVKMLERDAIMDSFLRRLIPRRDDKFYGYITRQTLKLLSASDANLAREEFTTFLNTAISYLEKWFTFSEEN